MSSLSSVQLARHDMIVVGEQQEGVTDQVRWLLSVKRAEEDQRTTDTIDSSSELSLMLASESNYSASSGDVILAGPRSGDGRVSYQSGSVPQPTYNPGDMSLRASQCLTSYLGGTPEQRIDMLRRLRRNEFGIFDFLECADKHSKTVILKNLPGDYTREDVLEMLSPCCGESLMFLHKPLDMSGKNDSSYMYAFVTLEDMKAAQAVIARFSGFSDWQAPRKIRQEGFSLSTWTHTQQLEVGLSTTDSKTSMLTQVEFMRNHHMMHQGVPDEAKPAVFWKGARVAFPKPTKHLKKPRNLMNR
jgi:hypothetical protein